MSKRLAAVLLAAACRAAQAQSAWLVGESHDQPAHQQAAAEIVRQLAAEYRLHALVLEMADAGVSTQGLAANASEDDARRALQWNDQAWPWSRYGALVMAAVRAGVPVHGGNRPRASLREAMQQPQWDEAVSPAARALLADAVRAGHCGLLPEAQVPGMVRMQVARDRSLADAVLRASAEGRAGPGEVTVLHAGAQHAARDAGVPLHLRLLAPGLTLHSIGLGGRDAAGGMRPGAFDEVRVLDTLPPPDHCAALRQRGMGGTAAASAASPSVPPSGPARGASAP